MICIYGESVAKCFVGRSRGSRGLIKSIWQTKEQLGEEDDVDVQIKTTLKELITYGIFFTVLLVGEK